MVCGKVRLAHRPGQTTFVSFAFTSINHVNFWFCKTLLRPRGGSILQKGFASVPTKCSRELLMWKVFELTSLFRVFSTIQVV